MKKISELTRLCATAELVHMMYVMMWCGEMLIARGMLIARVIAAYRACLLLLIQALTGYTFKGYGGMLV